MGSAKKTQDDEVLFYAAEGEDSVLTWSDLREASKSWRSGIEREDAKDMVLSGSTGVRFDLSWPDGRRVSVRRYVSSGKVVIEVETLLDYDKKVRRKLRRSFVEPRSDLLAAEVARHLGGLLKGWKPLYAERADQKEKRAKALERQKQLVRDIALALAGTGSAPSNKANLKNEASKWGKNLAITTDHTYRGKDVIVDALLARGPGPDGTEGSENLDKVTFEPDEDCDVDIEFHHVSPALAMTIAEAVASFVVPRIDCGAKGCDEKNLAQASQRRKKRCSEHGGRAEE